MLCRVVDVASRRAHNFLLLGQWPWRQPVAPDHAGEGQLSAREAGQEGVGSAGGSQSSPPLPTAGYPKALLCSLLRAVCLGAQRDLPDPRG